mgnify:CR=1 FL=1
MLKWTTKQREYLKNANHRWNFKVGAVRSGKTYQDIVDIIPRRIRKRIRKEGLGVIIGVTQATVERNILRPMRDRFGESLVGYINKGSGTVYLFGELCYALGAEKVNQVAKIQGASFKYVYGDEVAKWNKEVFDMVKSRLDKDYSCFDGTCNPEQKNHWLKEFLDSDADIYMQHYVIDDNDYLSEVFKENLKKEYWGTVLYQRYILGLWVNAEGLIYRRFADDPSHYYYQKEYDNNGKLKLPDGEIFVGIDYGGTLSGHSFVATLIAYDCSKIIVLASERHFGDIDPKQLEDLQVEFIKRVQYKYRLVDYVYPDSAEQVLIRGIRNRLEKEGIYATVKPAKKEKIKDRIDCERIMFAYDMVFFMEEDTKSLMEALESAIWKEEKTKVTENDDERLDDGTTDIDSLDAFEYSFERKIKRINEIARFKRGAENV